MAQQNETTGWVKIKEGDVKEFTVLDIKEIQPYGKIAAIPTKSYLYEFQTDIGKLTVNNLGLFSALVEAKVRVRDRIKVTYIKKGTLGIPSKFAIDILEKDVKNEDDTEFSQETFEE